MHIDALSKMWYHTGVFKARKAAKTNQNSKPKGNAMKKEIATKLEEIKATSKSREESLERGWRFLMKDYIKQHPEVSK